MRSSNTGYRHRVAQYQQSAKATSWVDPHAPAVTTVSYYSVCTVLCPAQPCAHTHVLTMTPVCTERSSDGGLVRTSLSRPGPAISGWAARVRGKGPPRLHQNLFCQAVLPPLAVLSIFILAIISSCPGDIPHTLLSSCGTTYRPITTSL